MDRNFRYRAQSFYRPGINYGPAPFPSGTESHDVLSPQKFQARRYVLHRKHIIPVEIISASVYFYYGLATKFSLAR